MRDLDLQFPLTAIQCREDLLAVVRYLLRDGGEFSSTEKQLLDEPGGLVDRKFAAKVRKAIQAGDDPLGEAYSRIFAADSRRASGITLTPPDIVRRVLDCGAALQSAPSLVVDCGAGTGRFIFAAARRFRRARLLACELDPLLALLLRANARQLRVGNRLDVFVGDFRELNVPASYAGKTLFVGNPPYVRHHDIPARWKRWYQEGISMFGSSGSQLAGLHFHFFLRTCQLATSGDAGCFVTSAEWLDTNYGQALRHLLLGRLGGRTVYQYSPNSRVFPDALTTAAITSFAVGTDVDGIAFSHEELPGRVRRVPATLLRSSATWSGLARPAMRRAPVATTLLGEYFNVHRGQVTGANDIWIESPETPRLPASVLFPTVTHATDLIQLQGPLHELGRLRRVIDLPADLSSLPKHDRAAVDRFLEWATERGVLDSYIARQRRPWWRVNLKNPPPVIMTYMGRRPPVFVRNLAGARLLNIAHGLYPIHPIDAHSLDAIVAWLNSNVVTALGRTYAGGLVKFEPREAMRIPVPPLDFFRHVA